MTLTPAALDTVLAQLQDEIAGVEASRLRAQNDANAAARKLVMLKRRSSVIQVEAPQLGSDAEAKLHSDQAWLANLNGWRTTLIAEQAALPDPDGESHTLGLHQNLSLSLDIIDGIGCVDGTGYDLTNLRLGALMRESGHEAQGADPQRSYSGVMPWRGSMPDVEHRIAKAVKQRGEAEARLTEAMLDDVPSVEHHALTESRPDSGDVFNQPTTN